MSALSAKKLARVNLDLTIEERRRYLDWMRKQQKTGKIDPAAEGESPL